MPTGLYIAMDFKPNLGGIAEHTHQMTRHLIELGEHITVLTPSRPGGAEFDRTCGYPVVRFNMPSSTSGSSTRGLGKFIAIARMMAILFAVFAAFLRLKPDYLIIDHWSFLASLGVVVTSKLTRTPYFLFVHGYEFTEKQKWESYRRAVVRSAAHVMPVSDYMRSLALADGAKAAKATVIYNGFDAREIDAYRGRGYQGRFPRVDAAFPAGSPIILSVTRLVRFKRIDSVIQAMPKVVSRFPNARYIIVGAGIDEAELRQLAADSPAADSITFMGPLTGDEKFECFQRCDVFAHPSEGEPFGIVFLEAMGFGKPVIGGRSGGPVEFITHEENGLLVDSNDVEEIADAIIELIEDTSKARALGENGRRQVESELSWKNSSSKFLSIAREALDERA